jgi:hypothetical protein
VSKILDWQGMKEMYTRLLVERTGEDLATWNERVRNQGFEDEQSLRQWLTGQGVTGYAQYLLVKERFGWPDFMMASADDLITGQYAEKPQLKPIFDAVIAAAAELGPVTIQTRKTYVSLVTRRRTFARVQPTTRDRVDLFLRLENQLPGGRLLPTNTHERMPVRIGLSSLDSVDDEVAALLQKAYDENR